MMSSGSSSEGEDAIECDRRSLLPRACACAGPWAGVDVEGSITGRQESETWGMSKLPIPGHS